MDGLSATEEATEEVFSREETLNRMKIRGVVSKVEVKNRPEGLRVEDLIKKYQPILKFSHMTAYKVDKLIQKKKG